MRSRLRWLSTVSRPFGVCGANPPPRRCPGTRARSPAFSIWSGTHPSIVLLFLLLNRFRLCEHTGPSLWSRRLRQLTSTDAFWKVREIANPRRKQAFTSSVAKIFMICVTFPVLAPVVSSSCPSRVGVSGVMVKETANAFYLVSSTNRVHGAAPRSRRKKCACTINTNVDLKPFQCVCAVMPKRGSRFAFSVGDGKYVLSGNDMRPLPSRCGTTSLFLPR